MGITDVRKNVTSVLQDVTDAAATTNGEAAAEALNSEDARTLRGGLKSGFHNFAQGNLNHLRIYAKGFIVRLS